MKIGTWREFNFCLAHGGVAVQWVELADIPAAERAGWWCAESVSGNMDGWQMWRPAGADMRAKFERAKRRGEGGDGDNV